MPLLYPPWTSIEAYRAIYDSLGDRRREALHALLEYIAVVGHAPTARELERFAGTERSTIGRRLTELRDNWSAIHNGPTRKCDVTDMTVFTWIPGPAPGRKLGERVYASLLEIEPKVRSLLEKLRQEDRRSLLGRLVAELPTSTRPAFDWGRYPPGNPPEGPP